MRVTVSRRGLLHGTSAALMGATMVNMMSGCTHAGEKKTASAQGSAGASGGSSESEPESDGPAALPLNERVGFALVGLGALTLDELLPAFAKCKYARAAALVSGDRQKAEKTAKEYGIDAAHLYDYAGFDRIADDPTVQVVYIVLPNSMHAEYTIRAAKAGKHVLCEKPMANSVAECEQMIAACAKANKKLMVAYRMQYEPFNREVIRMVRSGEIGKLKNMVTSNGQTEHDPNEWRLKRALAGGGPLPDVGIYCLNAARYLSGEEPIEVSAIMHSTPGDPRFTEVEEQFNFTLRFPSGFLASCATSYSVQDSKDYRLLAEKANVLFDPAYSYRGQKMSIIKKGPDGKEQRIESKIEEKNQFALEMDHMARCVLDDRRPHTPGEEGLQDMRIIAALYEAARTGRSIKLPEVKGLDVFRGPAPT